MPVYEKQRAGPEISGSLPWRPTWLPRFPTVQLVGPSKLELASVDCNQGVPVTLRLHIINTIENVISPTWGALVRRRATSGLL